jgi:hypothetical protein
MFGQPVSICHKLVEITMKLAQKYLYLVEPGDHVVKGVGLQPFTSWDCGFESC